MFVPPFRTHPEKGAQGVSKNSVLLRLSGVAKSYNAKTVLRDVSLTAQRGEVVLVTGPNGAGKSTLMGIMAGLIRPTKGEVQLTPGPERVGWLGHKTALYPGLTGLENLTFWAKLHGLDPGEETLLSVLARMELERAALDKAGRYSRGMAQRLALARVLLAEPDILFLDEPATGLDERARDLLRQEISSASERGAAVIWVSHDPERDLPLAHQVLALQGARPVYCGPATQYASGEFSGERPC